MLQFVIIVTTNFTQSESLPVQLSEPWLQNNNEWVKALSGQLGAESQRRSHELLGNYLYVVAFNYLRLYQSNLPLLASFADEEWAMLAEEFFQEFLVRLTVNQYARLLTYRGEGSFQKWSAVGLKRIIDKEFKKKSWHERERLADDEERPEFAQSSTAIDHLPEQLALEQCLQRLSNREREIFLRRIDHDEDAQEVANDLGTSANAIHIALSRIKSKLRRCLEEQGIGGMGD